MLIVTTVAMQVVGAALTENDLIAVDKLQSRFKIKTRFTRATGGQHRKCDCRMYLKCGCQKLSETIVFF